MTKHSGHPWPAGTQRLRLGEIEIDLRYRSVRCDDVTHDLNPRCFDLLLLFLRERGVLQTRDEIFRKIWPGVIVEDSGLTTNIWQLRKALGGTAKQWIRTVSKQGYVFDPPASIRIEACPIETADEAPVTQAPPANETIEETQSPTIGDLATPGTHAIAAPTSPARSWRKRTALTAALAMTLAAIAAITLHFLRPAHSLNRIALVATTDASLADEARWPTELMHAWLDWQLRSAPGIALAASNDNADNNQELAVLLSVDRPAQKNDEWRVSAHFRGAAPPADITRRSSSDQLVATIDNVSREVLAVLAPAAAASSAAPPLQLDNSAAAALMDGLAAEHRRRWGDAVGGYTTVVTKAPTFGFARVHLAQCQAELGQLGAAQAELARAQRWIDALPKSLQQPIQAQALLIRQDYAAAAAAFAAMQSNVSGENTLYRVAEADALRRADRSRDAAERLNGETPTAAAQAVPWLIARARIDIANGDPTHAAAMATSARELAHQRGWDHEGAQAALLLADAQARNGQYAPNSLFEQAAKGFEAAGDKLNALRARAYSRWLRAPGNDSHDYLDAVLAEARMAGNASVEIDALRRAATFHYRSGDPQGVYERLDQAAAVAEASGNQADQRLININLLIEDALRADFAALDRRLAALRTAGVQGHMGGEITVNAARLEYFRGHFDDALTTFKQAESLLREPSGESSLATATIACTYADVYIAQGQTAAARDSFRECRSAGVPVLQQVSDIGDAQLAIATGDQAEARRLLLPLRDGLTHEPATVVPNTWGMMNDVAALLPPIGESTTARQIIEDTLPAVKRSGYHMLEASLRITLAQIALAQNRPDDARREADHVETLIPADFWFLRSKLRTVRVLVALVDNQREAATQALDALHDEARQHGDVLTELLTHSLVGAGLPIRNCPPERRSQLLAQSGMRGASALWMIPQFASDQGKTSAAPR